jgi:hypothetical protein
MGIVIETDVKKIRKRAWHYLSPEVAARADMSLADMLQSIAGTFHPSETQLNQLARCMGMIERVS